MAKPARKQPDTAENCTESTGFDDYIDRGDDITTITFHGATYSFPTSRAQWPTRAMQAFQKRMNADGVELLLGREQWDMFNERHPTMGEFWEFFPLFARAAGFMREG